MKVLEILKPCIMYFFTHVHVIVLFNRVQNIRLVKLIINVINYAYSNLIYYVLMLCVLCDLYENNFWGQETALAIKSKNSCIVRGIRGTLQLALISNNINVSSSM